MMVKKYKFEIYFYNEHAENYSNYFENNARLPIWREGYPDENMTAEFLDYSRSDNKIIGHLNVLLRNEKDLLKYEGRKYLMNHPNRLVGHLILLDNDSSSSKID
ncbi:hypothetical protein ACWGOQ_0024075 [Aquimarina sp. M1]